VSAPTYNRLGLNYSDFRRPEPRIEAAIWEALGDARSVVNVGAGSGSYEPTDREVIAIEPSPVMIAQRRPGSAPALEGVAEALPLEDKSVDAAMGVLTIHHWQNLEAGLAEMRRVSRRRIVLLTLDAKAASEAWLIKDYFPELGSMDRDVMPSRARIRACLPGARIEPVPVPRGCLDGFAIALWERPEWLLDPEVRRASSPDAGRRRGAGARAPASRARERTLGREVRPPAQAGGTRRRPAPRPRGALSTTELLREASERDAGAIADLWTEAYFLEGEGGRTAPYTEADFFVTARCSRVFVAEREGAVVGVVALAAPGAPGHAVAQSDEAELSRLVVCVTARRLGVGRALVGRCHEIAKAAEWSAIALWSRRYQTAAHHLYESLGYERTPERDRIDESGHERLVFRLAL
jgi:ribosomal protein S18 acetylase RimI-like enzyme/SAM-dependent methyltransferase